MLDCLLQKEFESVITGWPKNLETWNNLEFDNLGKKKLEKPGILYKSCGKTWNFAQKSW